MGNSVVRRSAPVVIDWRWHYNVPKVVLWVVGIFTLLLWSRLQSEMEGWRMVVPALLAFMLFQMEGLGVLTLTLIVVWRFVWWRRRHKNELRRDDEDIR